MGVQLPRTQITVPTLDDSADMTVGFNEFAVAMERHFVNRFSTYDARATAIPNPSPGMMTYRADGKVVEYYDGNFNDWIPLTQSTNGINSPGSALTGSDSTTSATFVNLAGTGAINNFSFTKHSNSTHILVELAISCFISAGSADTDVEFAANINGTDYLIMRQRLDFVGIREIFMAGRLISGVPRGTYTVTARWRRESGTGTLARSNGDTISFCATEVVSFT